MCEKSPGVGNCSRPVSNNFKVGTNSLLYDFLRKHLFVSGFEADTRS